MAEYFVGVQFETVIEADSSEKAEEIAISNVQNCLEPHFIEVEAYEK